MTFIRVELTEEEYGLIKESLCYTQEAFEAYNGYPSPEFKRERIEEVRTLQKNSQTQSAR